MTSEKVQHIAVAVATFTAGFMIMALEILGSRMLAPTFGSSVFVWGSLIGVFLISMSLGYVLGGRLSNTNPALRKLSLLALVASLHIILMPYFFQPVCAFADSMINDPRWGSLSATILIFTLPLALLGAISPYAVRLTSRSLDKVGGQAGNLYALSTLGSFLGTIITAFYLIPNFPTRTTVQVLGMISFLIFGIFARLGKKVD